MLINKLKGGLGNQMFQYATGFALAQKNNTVQKIDITTFDNASRDTRRKFGLNVFKITSPVALSEEIKKVRNQYGPIPKFLSLINQKVFKQYYTDFHPEFLNKISEKLNHKKDVYIDGNFQSEKNFTEFAPLICQEFTFKKEFFDDHVKQLAEVIQKENSVSIHIRRGDYVYDKKTNKYHGVCLIEYYEKAIKLIKEKISNPVFYIFTDDDKWVTENFKIIPYINVSQKHLKDHEEMFLMSQCQHNIVANSSFSWWGAWLNKNSAKIVIAPRKWVNKKPNPHPNIIPETWLKI